MLLSVVAVQKLIGCGKTAGRCQIIAFYQPLYNQFFDVSPSRTSSVAPIGLDTGGIFTAKALGSVVRCHHRYSGFPFLSVAAMGAEDTTGDVTCCDRHGRGSAVWACDNKATSGIAG